MLPPVASLSGGLTVAARRANSRHDAAWKQFFALSVVVEHLLRGFFPEVAALLDLDTLRDVSGEWVQDGTRRRGDSVWRARYRDGSARSLMVFLEFQSTVDAGMARRVLRNVGMAYERARRNGVLDADGRLRPLCIVVHAGVRAWTAPGAAWRVAVSAGGEVASSMSEPYAALDARRLPREHLPARNLVSTLFELNGIGAVGDAAGPLARLGAWLPGLGVHVEPVRAAYAEWLATTMPTLFPGSDAAAMVERFTGADEEESMAVTVLEERLQRQLRRERRDGERRGIEQGVQRGIEQGVQRGIEQGVRRGIEQGVRRGIEQGTRRALAETRVLLASQAARRFGPSAVARVADLLAGIGDAEGLRRAGEWIVDCATAEELVERLEGGQGA